MNKISLFSLLFLLSSQVTLFIHCIARATLSIAQPSKWPILRKQQTNASTEDAQSNEPTYCIVFDCRSGSEWRKLTSMWREAKEKNPSQRIRVNVFGSGLGNRWVRSHIMPHGRRCRCVHEKHFCFWLYWTNLTGSNDHRNMNRHPKIGHQCFSTMKVLWSTVNRMPTNQKHNESHVEFALWMKKNEKKNWIIFCGLHKLRSTRRR